MLLQRQELATWEAITTSAEPAPASGEQFALPEAVGLLREVRRRATSQELVSPSAADPLNLVGIVTPGNTVPRGSGRVLYLDGVPIASQSGGAPRDFFGAGQKLVHLHLQLYLQLLGMPIRQGAMARGVGVHLGPIRPE